MEDITNLKPAYHTRWLRLLNLEKNVDTRKFDKTIGLTFGELINKGRAIGNLKLRNVREIERARPEYDGVTRRMKYELTFLTSGGGDLNESGIKGGSPVYVISNRGYYDKFDANGEKGSIISLTRNKIIVELIFPIRYDFENHFSGKITIVIGDSDITFERESENLNYYCSEEFKGNKNLLNAIVKADSTRYHPSINNISGKNIPMHDKLNYIVKRALEENDFFIIHGPFGTGKTFTCADIICKTLSLNPDSRILVCSHSNEAVDNILEKVALIMGERNEDILLRIGNPHKIKPRLCRLLLKNKIMSKLDILQIPDIDKIKKEIINQSRVIFSTNANVERDISKNDLFDLVVFDEATTAPEPSCLIPIARAKKLIIVGDPKQLPPVVKYYDFLEEDGLTKEQYSNKNKELKELENTLFQKLQIRYPTHSDQLNVEYRMNEDLLYFPNKVFYDNTLIAHPSVAYSKFELYTDKSIIFVNCKGNEHGGGERSIYNDDEVRLVKSIVEKYVKLGIDNRLLGVITFYKSQMKKINFELKEINSEIGEFKIECKSVDSYQGQEKEILILSTVRSNEGNDLKSTLGFLTDLRRINVALTRAKTKLIIIGDFETLTRSCRWEGKNKFSLFANLIDYIKYKGVFINEEDADKFFNQPTNPKYKSEIETKQRLLTKSFVIDKRHEYEGITNPEELENEQIEMLKFRDDILSEEM